MPKPVSKVEIGFDLSDTGAGPYLTLDDPVAGKLDDTDWVLGGTLFFDVTERVRSISINRGKNRDTDNFDPGLANIVFDNNDRTFDPTYESSPYYGQIIPKRQVRVSHNDEFSFVGVIDDWGLDYENKQDATTSAAASDAFSYFQGQVLTGGTQIVQNSGERVNAILSNSGIGWPLANRSIDTGAQTLGADVLEDGTSALSYLQQVEASEPGKLFIGKGGDVVFKDRTVAPSSGGLVLADNGSGIKWNTATVIYGSEQLYNEIVIVNAITGGTAIAFDETSQVEYGTLSFTRNNLLMETNEAALALAEFYATKYSQPEYRFDEVTILLNEISSSEQNDILQLEIGDVCEIVFTPSGIPPSVERYAEIIGISHGVDPSAHVVTLKFATLEFASLVLNDAEFGKLDSYSLAF